MMPNTVRRMNEARARHSLLAQPTMSRADLARALDLTRATASSIVGSLLERGEVIEVDGTADTAASRTGRPSIQLKLNQGYGRFLGADIGSTRISLCVVDYVGNKCYSAQRELKKSLHSPEEIAEVLRAMIDDYLGTGVDPKQVRGLNVAVPGVVDLEGTVLRAPPLGWKRVDFKQTLREKIQSVVVDRLLNDANAFALAAHKEFTNEKLTDALFVLLEDGVGGCIVSGGRILHGRSGFAGEFGHIPVGTSGFYNLTGVDGALENFVSRRAVIARYQAVGGVADTFQDYLDQLGRHEPYALDVRSECLEHLARGLAIATAMLNPQGIVIGGRASGMFRNTEEELSAHLARQLVPSTSLPQLVFSDVGSEGPAFGAALTLHRKFFALPGNSEGEITI